MWRTYFTFFLKFQRTKNFIYLDLIQIDLFLFVKKWDRSIDTFFQYNERFCSVNAIYFLDFVQHKSEVIGISTDDFSENRVISSSVIGTNYLSNPFQLFDHSIV